MPSVPEPRTRRAIGTVRLATPADHDAIHRLNYRTFVEEIPQHPPNAERRLVDRFHHENVYVVYEVEGELAGMICGRTSRPFSLDQKLGPIDAWLPPHRRAVELRLLAVERRYRATRVFVRLLQTITRYFASRGYDLGVLSGTTRQLALYRHLGCIPFGPCIGTEAARYQPMSIALDAVSAWPAALTGDAPLATRTLGGHFLPGPVPMHPAVRAALAQPSVSHRSAAFVRRYQETQDALRELTGARRATLLLGSGTLANDVVGAQLGQLAGRGVVASNGEFGERLLDHAQRLRLDHVSVSTPWGAPLDWEAIDDAMQRTQARWLWAVHSETSTGVVNDLDALRALAQRHEARLAIDAISSIGALPVSLEGVWMASTVSGKALAASPGVAIVLHDEEPEPSPAIPRYLDLGTAVRAHGVPFTQSSTLIDALHASLTQVDWTARHTERAHWGRWLRTTLEAHGATLVAPAAIASPVVHTIALPAHLSSIAVGERLREQGWHLAFESAYLRERNWVQLCLMGEQDAGAVRNCVKALTACER